MYRRPPEITAELYRERMSTHTPQSFQPRAKWPDKSDASSLDFTTQAVHVGNEIDQGSGAIRTPIVLANSYALPEDPSNVSWSGTDVSSVQYGGVRIGR